ncbi:MAG: hypothetical protein EOO74_09310 [Myxococcales bacterium]|nr:MAG: hypothetical protein EOO74_09310 [Myxococcales bacterium]
MLRRLLLPLAFASLLACSDDEDSPGATGGAPGQTEQPINVLVVHPAQFVLENTPLKRLADGDPFDLWSAEQGGHVALVGAQIEGIVGDTIELRARFNDPATGRIIAEESRTVVVVPVPGSDTLKEPNLTVRSQVTHVPLCPDYEDYDVVDREVELVITVLEKYTSPPRRGQASVRVVPRCGDLAENQALCQCECTANYTLGKCK